MCVTCGCGGKPATYEKIDKHSHKTTTKKEIKEAREVRSHQSEEAKKNP